MLTGMVAAHILKLAPWHAEIEFLTLTGLSYIMVEVGLEFSREKVSLRGHGFDFFVAVAANAVQNASDCVGNARAQMQASAGPAGVS